MSHPVYGRFQVAEKPRYGNIFHRDQIPVTYKAAHHPPLIGVLDQSDLIQQGIHTSQFIPGCKTDADALGSCTANGGTAHLSTVITSAAFFAWTKTSSYDDVVAIEKNAIEFYHADTMLSGNPSTEWPPTDCGSSGPYVFELAQKIGLVTNETVVSDADGIVSLLQTGTLAVGQPFFNAWESPDNSGFIDDAGIRGAVASGVAGGHETCWWGVEPRMRGNSLDLEKTVIWARNSWGSAWGDKGNYCFRLATFIPILQYCDIRQFI